MEEKSYYPISENKGAGQLRSYCEADLRLCFRIGKNSFFSRCGSFGASAESWYLVLGIGRENHYRLSEHISRLIIDCTIKMYVPLTLTSEVIKNAQYWTM